MADPHSAYKGHSSETGHQRHLPRWWLATTVATVLRLAGVLETTSCMHHLSCHHGTIVWQGDSLQVTPGIEKPCFTPTNRVNVWQPQLPIYCQTRTNNCSYTSESWQGHTMVSTSLVCHAVLPLHLQLTTVQTLRQVCCISGSEHSRHAAAKLQLTHGRQLCSGPHAILTFMHM